MKNIDTANEEKTEKKKKNILLIALSRHKISFALVLFFVFSTSAFAWFIYSKTVDMGLTAHVRTWNVHMGSDGESDTYEIELNDLYPGMATINGDSIPISNDGEMAASVSIEIKKLTLFGIDQIASTNDTDVCDARIDHSSGSFVCDYKLTKTTDASGATTYKIDGYPFVLQFYLGKTDLAAESTSYLNYSLQWDYESCTSSTDTSCDEKDTWYGEKSYEYGEAYKKSNPSAAKVPSLKITMTVTFTQKS